MSGSAGLRTGDLPYLRLITRPHPSEIAFVDIFCILAFKDESRFVVLVIALQTFIERIDLRRIRPVRV